MSKNLQQNKLLTCYAINGPEINFILTNDSFSESPHKWKFIVDSCSYKEEITTFYNILNDGIVSHGAQFHTRITLALM